VKPSKAMKTKKCELQRIFAKF